MNKNEIRSYETRQKLCDAFISLYLEKDIQHISIREITALAGCNRGTFYLHFLDIYDMFEKIKLFLLADLKKRTGIFITSQMNTSSNNIIEIIFDFYNENEKYFVPLVIRDSSFSDEIKDIIKAVLYSSTECYSEETGYIIDYHISAVLGVIKSWLKNSCDMSAKDLINIIYEISSKGAFTLIGEKLSSKHSSDN